MEGRNCTSMRDFYEVMEKDNSRKTEEENGGKYNVEEKKNEEGKGGIYPNFSVCIMYCCCQPKVRK